MEQHKWNEVSTCLHCNHPSERHYKLRFGSVFTGLYKCRHCKKRFNVITGTLFEGSDIIPLDKWFYAIYMFLSHKKGIISVQLSKDIGVTQKTAWFILGRIWHNLNDWELPKFEVIVQIDETYVGGKNKGRFKFSRGRSIKQKTLVVGVLTDDKVYTIVVPDRGSRTLKTIVDGLVKTGSTIETDEWVAYRGLSRDYTHEVVTTPYPKLCKRTGIPHQWNRGGWSQLKQGLRGIYHVVTPKYLQMYCDEFAYRYNTQKLTDIQRFIEFLTKPTERVRLTGLKYGYV